MPHFYNILCTFKQPNDQLLKPIFEFGQQHNWLIEPCNGNIPDGWSGDGIITDYLTFDELKPVRHLQKIPIVSRNLPPGGNVRTVLSDTREVARLALDFLEGQGFQNVATLSIRAFPGYVCGIPITPTTALQELAAKRNLNFYSHNCFSSGTKNYNYQKMLASLSKFVQKLPRPTALVLTSHIIIIPAYRALMEAGYRVPEEFAILCNTDSPLNTEYTPIPLSNISGEHRTVGLKLAETMQKMLENQEVPIEPVMVGPSAIVRRASTDVIAVPHLKLATAIRFLIQNYSVPVGIGEAAQYAGLSPSMLNRLFRRHLGKTGTEFLQQLRINRIKDLLSSTNMSLSKIAAATGYSSAVSLSLAFRRATGTLPGAYRSSRLLSFHREKKVTKEKRDYFQPKE